MPAMSSRWRAPVGLGVRTVSRSERRPARPAATKARASPRVVRRRAGGGALGHHRGGDPGRAGAVGPIERRAASREERNADQGQGAVGDADYGQPVGEPLGLGPRHGRDDLGPDRRRRGPFALGRGLNDRDLGRRCESAACTVAAVASESSRASISALLGQVGIERSLPRAASGSPLTAGIAGVTAAISRVDGRAARGRPPTSTASAMRGCPPVHRPRALTKRCGQHSFFARPLGGTDRALRKRAISRLSAASPASALCPLARIA